jgi:molybdate transport system substrate-binding protein
MRTILLVLLAAVTGARAETIRVSAAISLKGALEEIGKVYEKETRTRVELNLGGSGQLAAQIRNGAPVDLFLSAAASEVDKLDDAVDRDARRVIVRNQLVLIAPKDAKWGDGGFAELAESRIKRIAIGQPKTVPAGEYARQTLVKLDLWDKIQDRLVLGANVRQVLDYVQRGEVDAGIVYATDALEVGDTVKVVARADPSLHAPIEYVVAIVKDSAKRRAAAAFLDYLNTPRAKEVFARNGFIVDPPATTKATAP